MSLNFTISRNVNFLRFLTEVKKIKSIQALLTSDQVRNLEAILATETEETLFTTLEDIIGKEKTNELKQITIPFEQEFSDSWLKIEQNFKLLLDYYQKNIGPLNNIVASTCSLAGVNGFSINDIRLYVIISTHKGLSAWFSWSPTESCIVLECPIQDLILDKFAIGILAHEFFHLTLRKNSELREELKKVAGENSEIINLVNYGTPNIALVLEELVISSFVPEGYLAEKELSLVVGNVKNTKFTSSEDIINFSQTRKVCASHMYNTAKKYVDNGLPLDKAYFQTIVEEIKKG